MTDRNGIAGLIPKNLAWAEVGVYKGDFSQFIIDRCAPSKYYLIDDWRFEIRDHNPSDDDTENFSAFRGRIHWSHYGDYPNAHQEENHRQVKERFAGVPTVEVIRAESTKGIDSLPDASLDVIYIDANHQYEYVLRDMTHARSKLKPGGIHERCHHRLSQRPAPLSPIPMCEKFWTLPRAPSGQPAVPPAAMAVHGARSAIAWSPLDSHRRSCCVRLPSAGRAFWNGLQAGNTTIDWPTRWNAYARPIVSIR